MAPLTAWENVGLALDPFWIEPGGNETPGPALGREFGCRFVIDDPDGEPFVELGQNDATNPGRT